MGQMKKYWHSKYGKPNCFWAHQWNKHGTCISNLDPSCKSNPVEGEDIYSYFSKALELRSKYDLHEALAEHGISPSTGGKVNINRIRNAIQAKFNVTPTLRCEHGALYEIRLYFHVKNGDQYVPVDSPHSWRGNCRKTISYPPKR